MVYNGNIWNRVATFGRAFSMWRHVQFSGGHFEVRPTIFPRTMRMRDARFFMTQEIGPMNVLLFENCKCQNSKLKIILRCWLIHNALNKCYKECPWILAVIATQKTSWKKYYHCTHLQNKRFVLKFKFQKNASKFAIFLIWENPCSFFRFSFRAT